MKKVLTIAGSDSCGGAGIQADLKTFGALGVYGMSVITAVTAQNTLAVTDVMEVSREMVTKQIQAIFEDITVEAVKIGMVSNADIISEIKQNLLNYKAHPIVLDPVMVSKSGYHLLRMEAVEALRDMLEIADLVTPNIPEAEILAECSISNFEDMQKAAQFIQQAGAKNVLIKGGHRESDATDLLLTQNGKFVFLTEEHINTNHTHGTGCTLSSAIASYLALGCSIETAIEQAKKYITLAIQNSFAIGHGVGPVGHYIDLYQKAGLHYA